MENMIAKKRLIDAGTKKGFTFFPFHVFIIPDLICELGIFSPIFIYLYSLGFL